jgi:hypothetical protein
MALTRRKRVLFALLTIVIAVVGALLLLLAADLVVHYRAERSAGLNRYGYRGPVAGRKKSGEVRVAVVGGSTAFGYGVAPDESIPAQLEKRLRERLGRPVSVLNLAYNNEGAYSFVPNLEDFSYLDYDAIVLYEGYNDLVGDENVNHFVYRRNSAIFRLTGYLPILPIYLEEKAKMLRYGNNLNAAYDDSRRKKDEPATVVFRPGFAQRTSAAALDTLVAMTSALDGQLTATATEPPPAMKEANSSLGCTFPYVTYCESVAAAIRFGRGRGKGVVVASQPLLQGERTHDLHAKQVAMVGGMVGRMFSADPQVVWADSSQLVDLKSVDATFDAMHLKPAANATVAAALVDPVIRALNLTGTK